MERFLSFFCERRVVRYGGALLFCFSLGSALLAHRAGTAICNDGIGLSLPVRGGMAIGISLVVLGIILWTTRATDAILLQWGKALLCAGGCSNITERLLYGCIMDPFVFPGWGWTLWYYNVADGSIAFGCVLIAFALRKQTTAQKD